ncbi:MAG: efflux RND transporter permease subunit [Phenylobacterium sp.]|uniref:efflux RND transporter permease subunit n=2 Tax=Phenylobacterium sp. TaxID=1871053 RepID=UPI001853644D|nr:efflux RND transporter permease subunit [Phenylobacterium sp.]MBA4793067.1 efflux RND transporter permease subunit [Phenylobacterium sp.]
MKLGLSGRLTQATLHSPLTPLFLLAAIAMGLLALMSIPREEEPQISVPMVDIMVAAPGLRAPDAAELVAKPLETIVQSIDAVDHVYTQVEDDQVLVTARFEVGEDPDDAAVRVHEKVRANYDRIPVGIPEPMIVTRGINDVPAVVLTLSPEPGAADRWTDQALYDIALKLQNEVAKVEDVGLTFIVGGRPDEIRIEPDPERLALRGVPLSSVIDTVRQANRSFPAGVIREEGQAVQVAAGETLRSAQAVGLLTVASVDGEPVYLRDVANVVQAPREDQARVWRYAESEDGWRQAPAVSLAIAKRKGANAVVVAEHIHERVETLKGSLIPEGLQVSVSRDYGETANEKANELLFHLGLATVSIVILIGFAIGWREAGVTAVVIPTTILLTLFASNLMGYTINRVSLFALIFSIGILVDDAIVMIENIARHWAMKDGRSRTQATVEAVAEVGNPTVVATLTVVAALLPMLFVSGLMGPYMAPIPVNASAAMVFSFFVAVVIAPWLMIRFARQTLAAGHGHAEGEGRIGAVYRRIAGRVIASRRSAWIFLIAVGVATLLSMAMFATKTVTVKLLPFDNKSELQVVVDLPEGTSLEATERTLDAAAAITRTLPEVTAIEAYAGTASPFNFNGLVRHYFLRERPEMGDLAVTLSHKSERDRASHAVALDLRKRLARLPLPPGGSIKVVEAPPGPPVMATLLAEIYGPDAGTRRAVAAEVKEIFHQVPYIVDVDDSAGQPRPRLRLTPVREQMEYLGVPEGQVLDSIGAVLGGSTVGYAHRGEGRTPLEISIRLPQSDRTWSQRLATTPVALADGPHGRRLVELGEVVDATEEAGSHLIYRRDGRDAEMVTAELAGEYEAPIYGMLAVGDAIEAHDWGDLPKPEVRLNGQPLDESTPTLLWDGEWEITWVTFRDMGAAFAVAILGIYVLVVAQFKSFRLPLVILTPIPLTLVGIVIGHILFGAPFTATSMIGFIALAGIIVRNSILLVDFIRHSQGEGRPLRDVLLEAGAIRFKPIVLTALAAMIGAAVILFDPIFQGLAISLLFGLASSTLLTVLVIPAIYVVLRDDGRPASAQAALSGHGGSLD